MARSECGPDVTTDGRGDYDVLPSGDKSGDTDPQDIQCALSHMRSTGTTTLDGTDFYFAHGAFVTDVQGTLRGLGRDTTTLHELDDYSADQCGPGDNGEIHTYAVAFFYDGLLYSGAVTVSDVAVTAEGDAVVWCDHGKPIHDGVEYGIVAIAPVLPGPHLDIDFTFEHLRATGQPNPVDYMFSNLAFPYVVALTTSGNVKMGDIVADGVGNPEFVGWTQGAHIVIGGSDADAIVSHDVGYTSAGAHPLGDNDIEISHVVSDGSRIGIYLPTSFPGNDVTITDNTLRGSQWWGVLGQTGGTETGCCTSYDISHNVISSSTGTPDGVGMEDWSSMDFGIQAMQANVSSNSIDLVTPFGGIYGIGVQDMVVSTNTISGQLMAGVYVSPFGGPAHDCSLLGNNVQNVQPQPNPYMPWIPPTQIFLGWGTENCTVVGGSNSTNVIDDGQDNVLTGVNVQAQGQTLGSDVQDAMDSRGAELTSYGPR